MLRNRRLGEFLDLAATLADRKGNGPGLVAIGACAADERVERFEPVCQAALRQFLECTVDLKRCSEPVIAKPVEDIVGRQGALRMRKSSQDQLLVSRQVFCPDVIVSLVLVQACHVLESRSFHSAIVPAGLTAATAYPICNYITSQGNACTPMKIRVLKTLGVTILAACFSLMAQLASAQSPIRIVAAENFYGDLARQIGGIHVDITSILSSPNDDPHLFESTPSTARSLADAQIVIFNGAGYDAWMDRLLSVGGTNARTALSAAEITGHHSGDNPHIWYDPATFPAVAAALTAELSRRDPDHAAEFRANLGRFEMAFREVVDRISAIRASHGGTPVTATEPVFGYMAAAMGLEMLNENFQIAAMNETEPSASDVAAFEASLKNGTARILFYNRQVDNETTARLLEIANAAKVPVVGITETEPAGESIVTWFGQQQDAVEAALADRP